MSSIKIQENSKKIEVKSELKLNKSKNLDISNLQTVIFQAKTSFQDVVIGHTLDFGRVVLINDNITSSSSDEALYHEALVHPAMLAHANPRDILVLGGGTGAIVRELLKHRSLRSIDLVDIDEEFMEVSETHLFLWHRGLLKDPRVHVKHEAAEQFLMRETKRYDIIIIDLEVLADPTIFPLYDKEFYRLIRKRLHLGGIISVQAMEISDHRNDPHPHLYRTIRQAFPLVCSYKAFIPSLLKNQGFILASDWCRPEEWSERSIGQGMQAKLKTGKLRHLTADFIFSSLVSQ